MTGSRLQTQHQQAQMLVSDTAVHNTGTITYDFTELEAAELSFAENPTVSETQDGPSRCTRHNTSSQNFIRTAHRASCMCRQFQHTLTAVTHQVSGDAHKVLQVLGTSTVPVPVSQREHDVSVLHVHMQCLETDLTSTLCAVKPKCLCSRCLKQRRNP